MQKRPGRERDGLSKKLGCLLKLPGCSGQPLTWCSGAKGGLLMEQSWNRRDVGMRGVDSDRPPPVAGKQLETGHLDVVYLALPMRAFGSC